MSPTNDFFSDINFVGRIFIAKLSFITSGRFCEFGDFEGSKLIGLFFKYKSILSYLYADNPFYKAAEHLYIGLSAGYALVMAFWTGVRPNLFGRLWPDISGQTDDSVLQTLWYYVYEILNLITTCFGLFERSIFPEGGIPDYNEIKKQLENI